jgi:Methane oxygenase PmoA
MNRTALFCAMAMAPVIAHGQVEFQAHGTDHISIRIQGQAFSEFYIGPAYPKPFLAPLRAASGLVVTRRYPMESVEGESRDHPHHRGLFIGYGNVNGINFWENELDVPNTDAETPKEQGRMVLKALGGVNGGRKSGSLEATFEWRKPDGTVLMEERRLMTFYAEAETRTVDVDATFTAKTDVQFGDTKEGFFAIRIADSMAGKNGGLMTNSEGVQTERNVWGKRADWVDYDGTVDGQKVGIVVFDHPANYSHPPRWHVRDYGLFAINPFGLKDFEPKAAGAGGYKLAAGRAMRFRYRVIVHPGDTPEKNIADWYSEYAKRK